MDEAKKPAQAATQEQPTSFDMTLVEFCTRLSKGKAGPELIGGFHAAQIAAGKVKASEAEFAAAFEQFRTQPA